MDAALADISFIESYPRPGYMFVEGRVGGRIEYRIIRYGNYMYRNP